jgi:hypothetical protein
MLKNCHISWLEKFMHKSCKYRKSCAAKLSSNSCVEKIIHRYVVSNFLNVENHGERERNFP